MKLKDALKGSGLRIKPHADPWGGSLEGVKVKGNNYLFTAKEVVDALIAAGFKEVKDTRKYVILKDSRGKVYVRQNEERGYPVAVMRYPSMPDELTSPLSQVAKELVKIARTIYDRS